MSWPGLHPHTKSDAKPQLEQEYLAGSLLKSLVSYGSTHGPEIEKQYMRLQASLNNLMTDELATPNKIKSSSVVFHMLLLQALSQRAEPS